MLKMARPFWYFIPARQKQKIIAATAMASAEPRLRAVGGCRPSSGHAAGFVRSIPATQRRRPGCGCAAANRHDLRAGTEDNDPARGRTLSPRSLALHRPTHLAATLYCRSVLEWCDRYDVLLLFDDRHGWDGSASGGRVLRHALPGHDGYGQGMMGLRSLRALVIEPRAALLGTEPQVRRGAHLQCQPLSAAVGHAVLSATSRPQPARKRASFARLLEGAR